jgi:chromosomal replication initiation ATPase DnaA
MTSEPPAGRASQLILDLGHEEATGLADFIPGAANRAALGFLLAWPGWPHPAAVLCGPAGSGKSHLARIWAGRSGAAVQAAAAISPGDVAARRPPRLVIEDVAPGACDERDLFHLFNLCMEPGGALLVTTRTPPARLGFALADLVSRLRAATLIGIAAPDEALVEAVLVKLFADRQLDVAPAIAAFALTRMERSLSAARELVARVDRLSLAESRRVTRPLVARALDEIGAGRER